MSRRQWVENLLIDGLRDGLIAKKAAERYGVSTRMVRVDLRNIRARWAREDEATINEIRQAQVKALRRIAARATRIGDLTNARLSHIGVAHLLGMGNHLNLHVSGKVEHVHAIDPVKARYWVLEFGNALGEIGLLPVSVPCEVLPASNEHG